MAGDVLEICFHSTQRLKLFAGALVNMIQHMSARMHIVASHAEEYAGRKHLDWPGPKILRDSGPSYLKVRIEQNLKYIISFVKITRG